MRRGWRDALDDDHVVIATSKTMLTCFLVRRALVPGPGFLETRELDDRDALDACALLRFRCAETSEVGSRVTGHERRGLLRVEVEFALVARPGLRDDDVGSHGHLSSLGSVRSLASLEHAD